MPRVKLPPKPPAPPPALQQTPGTCVFADDEAWTCGHEARKRTGPLSKLFGKQATCALIGAPPGTTCPDYQRLKGERHRDLFDLVAQHRIDHPDED